MTASAPTDRTRLRRLPKRAAYDRATIDAILDEGLVCHVGFTVDGQPYVIPTSYARMGDHLVIHGSAASRMMRALASGAPACFTVSLIDGLVLARSGFHHSVNYRSVVILGRAEELTDARDKDAALRAVLEHVAPGRWEHTRAPDDGELKATAVVRVAISEASAKLRTGPPVDAAADLALPHWAGVIPIALAAGAALPDAHVPPDAAVPAHVRRARAHPRYTRLRSSDS